MAEREPNEAEFRARLRRSRPAPRPQFATDLRQHLADLGAQATRPRYLWLMVAACLAAGLLLLLLAALSASGGGPFGS